MKIVIIGGGVAGFAFGAIMQKKGHQVIINERGKNIPLGGNAFMMHEEGQNILKSIIGDKTFLPGKEVNRFIFNRPDGELLMNTPMESWRCMKRSDLISTLVAAVKKNTIKYDRTFSHFLFDSGVAVAAVFENGEVETGDLFVGADGCHSAVRQLILGETTFTKTEVKEILGTVKDKQFVSSLNNTFTKFQDKEKGLSFGFIPVSEDEIVWFSQFDAKMEKNSLVSKEEIRSFSKELLVDFPEKVKNIIAKTSLQDFYLWNTKDFDPLSTFHSANIVLVGDAAHVSLPFTSAGTTNALIDADTLSKRLENNQFISVALRQFYEARIESVRQHVNAGRKLKNEFLHPNTISSKSISIPLIKDAVIKKEEKQKDKLEIVYFTDPICSTCWTLQPRLRKLKHAFSGAVEFKYVMGGLLPSWNNFNRGGITAPSDVATHWNEVSRDSGMPIDGSIWNVNPLQSSYPSAIAFKAAQLQSQEKSLIFLRRLNEMVFLEGRNIASLPVIRSAAIQTGLDVNRLLHDIRGSAFLAFKEDLSYSQELGIDYLPTFLFKVNGENVEFHYGIQDYETFERSILKYIPFGSQGPPILSPLDVFTDYPSITRTEFKYLTDTTDLQADALLSELKKFGLISQKETLAGPLYFSSQPSSAFLV